MLWKVRFNLFLNWVTRLGAPPPTFSVTFCTLVCGRVFAGVPPRVPQAIRPDVLVPALPGFLTQASEWEWQGLHHLGSVDQDLVQRRAHRVPRVQLHVQLSCAVAVVLEALRVMCKPETITCEQYTALKQQSYL